MQLRGFPGELLRREIPWSPSSAGIEGTDLEHFASLSLPAGMNLTRGWMSDDTL